WHQYLGGAEIRPTGMLTLRIDLAAPVADLLDVLCQAFVAAPACLDALDAGDLSAAIGSGPYRLDDVSAGSITASARRDHFAGTPAHPAIAWIALPDPQDRLVHLAEECAEIATRLPTDALPPEGAALVRYADPTAIIYLFNQATGPLVDARVRRALNMAIDRTTLIDDVLGGAARPLHGFVSDAHFGAATGTDDPHDPGEARRLLSEAGHGTGLTLTVDCPTRLPDEAEALTAALAGQLAPLGVTLDIRRHADREAYAHMVRRKEIGDMCVFDSSPMSTFRVLHEKLDSRVSGAWWQGHRNPALERHLDRARRIADPDEREAVYRDIYRMVQADPPWLFLYTATRVLGLRGHAPGFDMPADGVLDVARLPRLVPAPARGA
ncbi:MAG: ABC transporter substrate-binding protein, partial [Pseudomonadota bacterium]